MTVLSWPQVIAHACELFHDTPGASLENRLVAAYKDRPLAVTAAIDKIGGLVAQGKVQSGFAVLNRELDRITAGPTDIQVNDQDERENAARKAETWIRNAGFHIDARHELEDALFGDFGQLRAYEDDYELRHRLAELWRELRPLGEKVEADAQQRADERKAKLAALKAKARRPGATA